METTLGVDVLGVVQPGAVQAVAATRNGRVGLLATPATIASGAYERAISDADPFVDVTAVACPDLTAIIEGGFPFDQPRRRHGPRLLRAAARGGRRHRDPRLHPLPAGAADAPADARPRGRDRHLRARRSRARSSTCSARAGSATRPAARATTRFLSTGDVDAFQALGTRFLQMPLGPVEHVDLRQRAAA